MLDALTLRLLLAALGSFVDPVRLSRRGVARVRAAGPSPLLTRRSGSQPETMNTKTVTHSTEDLKIRHDVQPELGWEQKHEAELTAWSSPNVTQVHNELVVQLGNSR